MVTQMSVMDSAFLKAEFAVGERDIPLSILMKKYGLSDSAQASVINGVTRMPFLMDSPSVNYGRATIVEAYWVVEVCIETKYHTIFFNKLEKQSPEIFMEYFQKAMGADRIFQLSHTEANWLKIIKIWTEAQAELWRLIKSIVIEHELRLLNSQSLEKIAEIMKAL